MSCCSDDEWFGGHVVGMWIALNVSKDVITAAHKPAWRTSQPPQPQLHQSR